MPKSDIPGYDDALSKERNFREEIFLDLPAKICGIYIHEVTPFLFARLCAINTPFLGQGTIFEDEIVRFLWALSVDFTTDTEKRKAFQLETTKSLAGKWKDAELEIDVFLEATFMDSPMGSGGDCVPYVSGIAWMIFRMGCDPFNWKKEETLHAPMRLIYQLMKCQDLERGRVLYNPISDKVKAYWLDALNANRGGNN